MQIALMTTPSLFATLEREIEMMASASDDPLPNSMSAELSYVQLKVANEARASEEVRCEQRRRNLLVLILHYLQEEGFLDTANAFRREAGPSLAKFDVCDNIDLPTILQEYESYYYVKFKKNPKITKRIADSSTIKETRHKPPPSNRSSSSKASSCSLPDLPSAGGVVRNAAAPENRREKKKSRSTAAFAKSTPSPTGSHEDLGLTGSAIKEEKPPAAKSGVGGRGKGQPIKQVVDVRSMLNGAIGGISSENEDRLLKPIAGFAGYNGEMRELAAVISRDIYSHNPDVHWDDIIGLDAAKRLVKEAVVYPIKYPQLFTGILSPWKGLLLYGPPGTGKTMLAKAVATECHTTFFNISASSIVSKWRGDSEKLVRVLFELARFHAPSTIFMDELESIMGQRSGFGAPGGEHEGSKRMKTELLVQMDGLAKSSDLVFVLAASNLPWELDHAMLRRLEKRILVDLPTEAARCAMVRHYLPPEVSPPPLQITSEVDYQTVAKMTDGYSGSDVKLVCKEAAMHPVRKVFDKLEAMSAEGGGGEGGEGGGGGLEDIVIDPIRTGDVRAAISRTKPSAKLLAKKYLDWQSQYESV